MTKEKDFQNKVEDDDLMEDYTKRLGLEGKH